MDLKKAQSTATSTRRTAVLFTGAALAVAIVFSLLMASLLGRTYAAEELYPVVVAATKVPALRLIEERHLKLTHVPKSAIPDDSYSAVQQVLEEPRLTLTGLVAGEPVIATRLASPEHGIGMALVVPPNMRAFAVRVSNAIAIAEMLRPGVFVDVVATFEDPTTKLDVTKLVLQNVEVLGVGRDLVLSERHVEEKSKSGLTGEDRVAAERQRVVTLLVTPRDVEYLAHAASGGSIIDLALRSGDDGGVVKTNGVTVRDIVGMVQVSSSAKSKPESPVVSEARRPRSRNRVTPSDRGRNKQPTIIKVK